MVNYDAFDSARIKHLEMLEAVIARLGTNGFLVKGWSVTVAGAFLGFAVTKDDRALALASLAPTIIFWVLDAYFLRTERLFRCLYERVRLLDAAVAPFYMSASAPEFVVLLDDQRRKATSHWATFRRPALSLLYGALILTAVLLAVVIGEHHGVPVVKPPGP